MRELDSIDYISFINEAMLGVVRKTLKTVEKHGLLGKHYFVMTFSTRHNGVLISNNLKKMYPSELKIVLQHQFSGLKVLEDFFCVTLHFNGTAESIRVPFSSILHFADPSVNFELHFKLGFTLVRKSSDSSSHSLNKSGGFSAKAKLDKAKKKQSNGKVLSLSEYRNKKDFE